MRVETTPADAGRLLTTIVIGDRSIQQRLYLEQHDAYVISRITAELQHLLNQREQAYKSVCKLPEYGEIIHNLKFYLQGTRKMDLQGFANSFLNRYHKWVKMTPPTQSRLFDHYYNTIQEIYQWAKVTARKEMAA